MATEDRTTRPGWVRALTTGWVLSPILVVALLALTFEGYGYYTRHQKTTYSRGGAFNAGNFNTAHSTSSHSHHASGSKSSHSSSNNQVVTNGGKHVTTLHSGSGNSSSTHRTSNSGNNNGSSPVTSHTPSTHSGHSSSPKPSNAPNPPSALVTPKVGDYTLSVRGHEQAKFGPLSPCNNNFPTTSTLDVHHASGESNSSYDFDWRLYPSTANRHDERHIYSYSKNSVLLTFEQETVTCAGIKQSTAVDYSPAQTRVQLPLTVGATWHNHGGGSDRTETGNSEVDKKSSITVGGHSYTVYEISTKLALTGSETGERDQTWWYAPELGMPLKFAESLQGKRSGASYSESYTATVVKMP